MNWSETAEGTGKVYICVPTKHSNTTGAHPTLSEIVQGLDPKQIYPSVAAMGAEIVEQERDEFTVQITEIMRLAIQASNGRTIKA